ncbi:SUKH-4 family immunity protein [Streptomyces sp. LHD-70]|uniref:SUKH-4 family immunity protein n=1 Tax=Streptomyces sp. LHD-70 TaxID=3072140 RepID=UPI00280CBE64|nr:SUKH-4 family immunity protein [Streptomyces sp. LHD-70]MDQ8707000.1 SUKH-4 family immunity protein [Streptomyces sp. LHD-70]
MIDAFRRSARPYTQFIVERSAEKPWVVAPKRNEVTLAPPSSPVLTDADLTALVAEHPALRALATAELRRVPLLVWEELCRSLGIPATQQELRELTAEFADLLVVTGPRSGDGFGQVGFRAESARHRIRALRRPEHDTVVASLMNSLGARVDGARWRDTGPVGEYAAQTLALHAVGAGVLDELLDDGVALANLDAEGLLQALAVTWPFSLSRGGVPQDSGISIDAHYLERLGLASTPHEEWVSWLRHCALNRGRNDLVRAIDETGSRLPWRTTWSTCRPFGLFGRVKEPLGGAAGRSADGVTATDAEQFSSLAAGYGSWPAPETEPPVREVLHYHQVDFTWTGHNELRARGSMRLSDREWLLVHPSGAFAVRVAAEFAKAGGQTPPAAGEPYVEPITHSALWQCPQQALEADAPTRTWMEATFGPGTCHPVSANDLPADLTHAGTRRFLTEAGLPALSAQLPFVSTADLSETTLLRTSWPDEDVPPPSAGPFFRVGEWVEAQVLLDGSTGVVYQDCSTAYETVTLASGLRQLCILLRLYHEFLISDFTTIFERRDALRSFRRWANAIDPATEDADHWEHVLDGSMDTDTDR